MAIEIRFWELAGKIYGSTFTLSNLFVNYYYRLLFSNLTCTVCIHVMLFDGTYQIFKDISLSSYKKCLRLWRAFLQRYNAVHGSLALLHLQRLFMHRVLQPH